MIEVLGFDQSHTAEHDPMQQELFNAATTLYLTEFSKLHNDRDDRLDIAFQESNVVGVANTFIPQNGENAYLYGIITHPDYRRQKVGRLLMDHVLNAAKVAGCNAFELIPTDSSNRNFYASLQFEQDPMLKMYMRKAL
jgi:GNAT superfamily N-acetyltransferase